jgi:tight adherence protein B
VTLTAFVAIGGAGLSAVLARAARRADPGRHIRGLTPARRWRIPSRARAWLERSLADAALDIDPESACEIAAVVGAGAAMLAYAVSPGLLLVVVPLLLAAGPVALRVARGRALHRFVSALPAGVEQVAAALRGGAGVGEAVAAVADAGGPLAADLARVQARAALGVGVADALAAWPAERPLPSVRAVAGSLAVASTIGGRAADALDGLAASLRERLGAIAEARALSAQSRMSAFIVGAAPLGYLLFSAALDPSSVDALVTTHVGRVCLVAGIVCEVLAALWMRRILSGCERE